MTQQKPPILDERSEGNDHSISNILNRLSLIHFDYMEKDSFYCNPNPDKDKPKRMNGWTFFFAFSISVISLRLLIVCFLICFLMTELFSS